MPVRRPPTSFTAGRDLTIAGTTVAAGATVTLAQAKALGASLSPLVSRGYLFPTPTQYPETARRVRSWRSRRLWNPYSLSPRELQAL